jgi:hypothetical protein
MKSVTAGQCHLELACRFLYTGESSWRKKWSLIYLDSSTAWAQQKGMCMQGHHPRHPNAGHRAVSTWKSSHQTWVREESHSLDRLSLACTFCKNSAQQRPVKKTLQHLPQTHLCWPPDRQHNEIFRSSPPSQRLRLDCQKSEQDPPINALPHSKWSK